MALRFTGFTFVSSSILLTFTAAAAGHDDLKAILQARFPDAVIQSVSESPYQGWYEVVAQNELAYTNADGSVLFSGRIIDTKSGQDLTAQRLNQLRSIDFKSLPFEKAIKLVKGDGSRRLALFADPLCPYCVQLEAELAKADNLTVYIFLFPLEGIHPGATAQAGKIWCSPNPAGAWSEWMLKQSAPGDFQCDGDPTTDLVSLGRELKINATPTLFFADGRRVSGALSLEELERELAEAANAEAQFN